MTQPTFVPHAPIAPGPQARRYETPEPWSPTRPAELAPAVALEGRGVGSPGPNQGYALSLAHRFHSTLVLTPGEAAHDVEVGAALVACKRAALFGRAPSIHDVRLALTWFGFLAPASSELVAFRRPLFSAIGHSYVAQRALVDLVPEATLRLGVEQAESLSWTEALALE